MRNCIRLSWIGLAMVLVCLLSVGAILLVGVATEGDEETPIAEKILSMFSTDDDAASKNS